MTLQLTHPVQDQAKRRGTAGKRAGPVKGFLINTERAAGGLPLGVMEGAAYRSAVVDLGLGDELLIVTDGITEAMDAAQNEFGRDRLTATIRENAGESPDHIANQIMSDLKSFSQKKLGG